MIRPATYVEGNETRCMPRLWDPSPHTFGHAPRIKARRVMAPTPNLARREVM